MVITESFDDYDQVLEYYKNILYYWKNYQNSRIMNNNQKMVGVMLLKPEVILKVYINSAISKMSRNMEALKHNPEIEEELYNKLLKNVYIKNQLDKYVIKKDKSLSEEEIIKSIRGMLAHAGFKIVNDNNKIYISIDNEKIRAVLPFTVINGIANVIRDYKLLHTKRDSFIANYNKLIKLDTTNRVDWKDALSKVSVVKSEEKIVEYINPYLSKLPSEATFFRFSRKKKIPIQQNKLDAEGKRLIGKYLRYFGERTWIKLSPDIKNAILTLFINKIVNNEFYDAHCEYYFVKPLKNEGEYYYRTPISGGKKNDFDQAINTPYVSPFAFTSVFADYAFYALNFAKEASTKDGINEAIYQDIEVQDTEFLVGKEIDYIKYIDNPQYLIDEKDKLLRTRKNLRRRIRKLESQREGISKNKEFSDEYKTEKTNNINNDLVKKNSELENVEYSISILNNRINNFKPHYAYTNEFFRRLRNSITHSYEVDYSKGLYSRNFDNIVMTLSDFEDGDTFQAKIRIGELERIIETITERIKQKAPYYRRHKDINLFLTPEEKDNQELVETLESKINDWTKDTNFKYNIAEKSSKTNIDEDYLTELFMDYGLGIEEDETKGEKRI